MLEHTAEPFVANDLAFACRFLGHHLQREVTHTLVRPFLVVMLDVGRHKKAEMVLTKGDEVVEALGLYRQDKSLRESIEVRRCRTNFHRLDPVRFEAGVERLGEFRVEVVNKVRWGNRFLIRQQDEITCLLQNPLGIGVRRHAGDDDATRSDVQEEKDVIIDQSVSRPDFLGEEIAGPKRGKMALDESIPCSFFAFRARIDARLTQNVGDGGSANAGDSELLNSTARISF
jgi:hypothetical protein